MMQKLAIILISIQFILGQVTQEGIPYSKIHGLGYNVHMITLPQVDNNALIEEDIYREMGAPYRYGFKHDGNYSPTN